MNTNTNLSSARNTNRFYGFDDSKSSIIDACFDEYDRYAEYRVLERNLSSNYSERVYSSDDF